MMSNIKTFKPYELKTFTLDVKDIDTAGRRVKVALSKFNVIDSDGDVIRRGAFSKSIQERGAESASNRKVAFLRYHNWEHPIGKWINLEETSDYLIGIGELGKSTLGNDAFLDYQDGIIREHSIGFNYIPDKMALINNGDTEVWEIKELVLWEGSAVTFGANQFTPTFDVSKGNKAEVLEALNTKMSGVIAALKNGLGTDDRLYSLEMSLKVLQSQYNELILQTRAEDKERDGAVSGGNSLALDSSKAFYLSLLNK